MNNLFFEWDSNKNALNVKKHEISFEEAKTVFSDQFARLIQILITPMKKTGLFYLEQAFTHVY